MSVHVVQTGLVRPVIPTNRHALALTGADLYWSEYGYARTVYFYRTQEGHELGAIVQSLKHSLSTLLVHFYPVAGRLVDTQPSAADDDDSASGDPPLNNIVLDCNDAGVEFIEAHCSDVDFGLLQEQGFRVQDFFAQLTRTDPKRLCPEDPVVSLQVTSFPGGGIAIGSSCDHMLFDGFSLACMMKCWAELCNGVPELSTPPHHVRRQLDTSVLPRPWTHRRPASADILSQDALCMQLQMTTVPITASMLEKLRAVAEADAASSLTSFECLAAHVWKARTKADMSTQQGKDIAHNLALLRFRVNIRSRLIPKLPPTAFGPALILAQAGPVTAGQLVGESLGATASRIHEAVLVYTNPNKIQQELERYELERYVCGNRAGVEHGPVQQVVCTEIGDARTVGFYDAHFGWGELKAIRPAIMSGSWAISFAPPPPGGSVKGEDCKLELIVRLTSKETEGFMSSLLSAPWPN